MRDFSQWSYRDIVRIEPFDLSEEELENLLSELSRHRDFQLENVTPSVSILNERIELSHHLLMARSTQKMAKQSLQVAVVSACVSTVAVAFTFFSILF